MEEDENKKSATNKPEEIHNQIKWHRGEIAKLSAQSNHNVRQAEVAKHQSEIFVLASQLAEISTRRVIHVTWVLAFLTAALLVYTMLLYYCA